MYCRDADPGTWPKNICNLMAHFILKYYSVLQREVASD